MRETWDNTMIEGREPCARAEDLIAYLYKEATPSEAKDFEQHLQSCVSCSAEAGAFGFVREAIGEWRQQALGSPASTAVVANASMPLASTTVGTSIQRRSALTALREFFMLSPAWMRAATAIVAVVFCALAVIAVAYFAEQPKVLVVESPGETNSSQQGNATQVANKDGELPQPQAKADETPGTTTQNVVAAEHKTQTQRPLRHSSTGSPLLANKRKLVLPRSISRPSEELVSANDYLPFTASSKEEKLPSLVDLADEQN